MTEIMPPPQKDDYTVLLYRPEAVVYFSKLESVDRLRFKGDNVISKDCFLYRLKLRDGKTHDFYLYQFGKAAENEIFQIITSYVAAN